MVFDFQQAALVEARFKARAFQHLDEAFSGVVAGAETERTDSRVDAIGARFAKRHQPPHSFGIVRVRIASRQQEHIGASIDHNLRPQLHGSLARRPDLFHRQL